MLRFIGSRRQTWLLRHLRRDERFPTWSFSTYEQLYRARRLPAATYIFLAVDRLDVAERRLAGQFYRHINGLGAGWRALNDPAQAMGRYRVLRTLHEAGINDFNAYLAAESARPERYPVFVRRNALSTRPLTGLLGDRGELERELDRLRREGEPEEDLLIIEYCAEEAAPGLYRKLACYRFGDDIILNPALYSPGWYVKMAEHADGTDALLADDHEIVRTGRHAEVMRRAFEIAHIEYGRIDFGLVGGRPQIYEINFNPNVHTQLQKRQPKEQAFRNWSLLDDLTMAALRRLQSTATGTRANLTTPETTAFRWRFWRNYAPQRY